MTASLAVGCGGDGGGSGSHADSPSGLIAYESYQPDRVADIYVINADGTGKRPLIQGPDYEASPAWSPDGTRLAFVTPGSGGGDDIHVLEDGYAFNVTNDPAMIADEPAWSPDGHRIAFASGSDGTREREKMVGIYVINEHGSGMRRLTNNESDASPAWSPDGARIAFERDSDLYVVDVDSGAVSELTRTEAPEYSPAWSPDGRRIAFHRDSDPIFPESNYPLNDELAIWIMNVSGGGEHRLLPEGHGPRGQAQPTWSPDGRWIAFRTHARSPKDEAEPCQSIYVAKVDGSALRKVTACTRVWGAGHWIDSADAPSWGVDAEP